MPRPKSIRKVSPGESIVGLKPLGIPMGALRRLSIGEDEVEALRLADLEGLYQEEAARRMGISRPTFSRLLARARQLLAQALIERAAILVAHSPTTVVEEKDLPCPIHRRRRRRGRRCLCARHGGSTP